MSIKKIVQPGLKKSSDAARFFGVKVAIVPFPALGDITIYVRLAWHFYRADAIVTFYSNALYPARECFPWLEILPEREGELRRLAADFDLLIACFEKYYFMETWRPDYAHLRNVAYVTAKKIPQDSGVVGRDVIVKGRVFQRASRAFCLNSRAGGTMVDWVDNYAKEVFSLEPVTTDKLIVCSSGKTKPNLVLIFPTTPQQKKNYWLRGFFLLGRVLRKRGWEVEFICMPNEQDKIASSMPGFVVKSFPDIKALMGHMAGASTVISNDSGGGHLGSMMGLSTYTITRRHKKFVWRPGFNENCTVVYPWFRFKWIGKKYIWRPFVPLWRIVFKMGEGSKHECYGRY